MHCFSCQSSKHSLQWSLLCLAGNCTICFTWRLVVSERCESCFAKITWLVRLTTTQAAWRALLSLPCWGFWLEFQMCNSWISSPSVPASLTAGCFLSHFQRQLCHCSEEATAKRGEQTGLLEIGYKDVQLSARCWNFTETGRNWGFSNCWFIT